MGIVHCRVSLVGKHITISITSITIITIIITIIIVIIITIITIIIITIIIIIIILTLHGMMIHTTSIILVQPLIRLVLLVIINIPLHFNTPTSSRIHISPIDLASWNLKIEVSNMILTLDMDMDLVGFDINLVI